jgi:misacylated tRNA(Ala) deacylase
LPRPQWNIPTESWCLGPNRCFIHLGAKKFSQDQVDELERMTNDAIVSGASMLPRWIEDGSPELEAIRSRGLPPGTVGPVRCALLPVPVVA